jgi:hypothetical protein
MAIGFDDAPAEPPRPAAPKPIGFDDDEARESALSDAAAAQLQPTARPWYPSTAASEMVLIQKQLRAKNANRLTSELIYRRMIGGDERPEILLTGQAHLIIHVTNVFGSTPPPYAREVIMQGNLGLPPIPEHQILWFAEITKMTTAPNDDWPFPPRIFVGCLYAFLVPYKANVVGIGVIEPIRLNESGIPHAQTLHRKRDRIWLLFRAILAHTRSELWSRYSALQVDASFCIQHELAAAFTVLQLPNPFHNTTNNSVEDVDMNLILRLKESFEEQTVGGVQPTP